MSQTLGRALRPGESVHHKNGIRLDNRPANLELWLVGQPAGQRVSDLIEWARWLLEQYDAEIPTWEQLPTDLWTSTAV
jgi:hypothetical protein